MIWARSVDAWMLLGIPALCRSVSAVCQVEKFHKHDIYCSHPEYEVTLPSGNLNPAAERAGLPASPLGISVSFSQPPFCAAASFGIGAVFLVGEKDCSAARRFA